MGADFCYGKTFLERYPAMKGETLPTFLEAWSKGKFLSLPMGGPTQESSHRNQVTASWNGAFSMLNTSEFLRDVVESSLYAILEHGGVDRRFYLSARACRGILSRAEKHHKVLPDVLMKALTRIAEGGSTTSNVSPSPRETSPTTSDPEDG